MTNFVFYQMHWDCGRSPFFLRTFRKTYSAFPNRLFQNTHGLPGSFFADRKNFVYSH